LEEAMTTAGEEAAAIAQEFIVSAYDTEYFAFAYSHATSD
jgi:hypothetical protein